MVEVRKGDAEEPDQRASIGLRRALPSAHWRMFALLLALVALLGAQRTAAALAADGLPPGVPVPAWAKGKKVHFYPAEPPSHRVTRGEPIGSSAKVGSLASSAPRLQYWGGLVENAPRLMLIFYGAGWEAGSALALRHELEATAESLPGSGYQKILTQYGGLFGPISSPLVGSPVIEKYYDKRAITKKVDGAGAAQEAREVIQLTGGSEDTNATYAVLPAPGTAEVELRTCGFHEENGIGDSAAPGPSTAAIMDTEGRIGCNSSKTLTHEYAESVTDPGSGSWSTGEGGNDEIGDLCNGMGSGRLAGGAVVALLWDDSKNACEVEDSNPGSVPIGPYADSSHSNPSLEGSTNQTVESETLETSVYPCDLAAHYYFEYGPTTAYGSKTAESALPAKWGSVKVSVTVAGLQHSTPYHWRVVVRTSNGTADGVDHEFSIPYDAEVKEGEVSNVGFSEATLNGDVQPAGVETEYYFEYGTTETYGSRTAEASAGSGNAFEKVSAVLTGLTVGTLYHYRLVASNSRGTTVGKDQTFSTHGGKPVATTWTAILVRYTEATLEGAVGPKGVATSFDFEYGTTSAYGQQTGEQSAGEAAAGEEERAHLVGLTPGTTYHFRIVATNSYGTSYGADESFSTREEPLAETGAPSAVGYETAALSGAINPHGTNTGYYFEYGTRQTYGEETAEVAVGSGTSDIQAAQTISHLAQDTTYHFRLVASTIYGNIYGADRTFSTGIEPLVQTEPATSVDSTEATLKGTLNPYGVEASYYFEYGLTPGYGLNTAQVNAGSGSSNVEASQAIAELSPGATYHYRLVAVYHTIKLYGNEVKFTATPLVPLVEAVAPAPPATPLDPIIGPAPFPTPGSPTRRGLSLHVAQHGSSLLVLLRLDSRAVRVEVDAAVPGVQLGAAKPRGRRVSVVLARTVRTNVEVGQSKLVLPLDAKGRRALRRRRRLTLTVTVVVTSSSGEQQTTSRMLALASR